VTGTIQTSDAPETRLDENPELLPSEIVAEEENIPLKQGLVVLYVEARDRLAAV
jgi:hypothetical protein